MYVRHMHSHVTPGSLPLRTGSAVPPRASAYRAIKVSASADYRCSGFKLLFMPAQRHARHTTCYLHDCGAAWEQASRSLLPSVRRSVSVPARAPRHLSIRPCRLTCSALLPPGRSFCFEIARTTPSGSHHEPTYRPRPCPCPSHHPGPTDGPQVLVDQQHSEYGRGLARSGEQSHSRPRQADCARFLLGTFRRTVGTR
jgi:hypothetical protein